MYWIFIPIFVLIDIFGNSILERTSFRGSIGKKIVGIEVTDEYENPETFSIALMRNIVKYLNLLTFGIGFIMCLGNKKKQTLSDKITKTYVINKINFNSEEKKDYASIFKRLTAFIIDIIFLIILNYIIIYAINYLTVNFKLSHNINELKYVIVIFTNLIYFPFNESKRGKTIGKKYMKIRVTDKNENTNSFIILFIRQLLIIIDIISLGFLLPFVNEEKQTIKDKITKTIVIND